MVTMKKQSVILIILVIFAIAISIGCVSAQTMKADIRYDEYLNTTDGEYTVQTYKWEGSAVGGFEVYLYKNGKLIDADDFESRAYFYMDGEWKWGNWAHGEEANEMCHKYPVSSGVEIKEVEVRF